MDDQFLTDIVTMIHHGTHDAAATALRVFKRELDREIEFQVHQRNTESEATKTVPDYGYRWNP